ncbi:hypothetical protein TRFO_22709 [Tritrichomonas foetus]|uniref:Uncharacterized protein n=1 Tax=Tritrichomonas foetus TaxID=1144522 RepID=A0A1J4KCC6_9EUKA|nr:hypothetical protein TRFO_22709 [Tritrichomonas foetus]|eukprot:OHT08634.1 hypothetical protein TRFO_22709 [Tritrichomonas foetus]
MYHENSFGLRQSPSLAEALHQTPQLGQQWLCSPGGSTPNAFSQTNIKSIIGSSSQNVSGPIVRCSPVVIEEVNSQPPQRISPQSIFTDQKRLAEMEKKLCEQVDMTLKMHYKRMKGKLKMVKSRVQQNDISIHRIQELVDTVSEHMNDVDFYKPVVIQQIPMITYDLPPPNSRTHHRKITWRKSSQSKHIISQEGSISQTISSFDS